MEIINKILRKIKINKRYGHGDLTELVISKEEAEQLGDIRELDGVKLVVYEIKKDCFAYNEMNKDCNALTELVCKNAKCKFYKSKTELSEKAIEDSIKEYSINMALKGEK